MGQSFYLVLPSSQPKGDVNAKFADCCISYLLLSNESPQSSAAFISLLGLP